MKSVNGKNNDDNVMCLAFNFHESCLLALPPGSIVVMRTMQTKPSRPQLVSRIVTSD